MSDSTHEACVRHCSVSWAYGTELLGLGMLSVYIHMPASCMMHHQVCKHAYCGGPVTPLCVISDGLYD